MRRAAPIKAGEDGASGYDVACRGWGFRCRGLAAPISADEAWQPVLVESERGGRGLDGGRASSRPRRRLARLVPQGARRRRDPPISALDAVVRERGSR